MQGRSDFTAAIAIFGIFGQMFTLSIAGVVVEGPSCEGGECSPEESGLDVPSVTPKPTDRSIHTCFSYGPNYYRTFDSLEFLFSGRCTYTVFTDGLRTVDVSMIECHKYSTCRKKLTIKLNSQETVVAMGDSILYNDQNIGDNVTMSSGWSTKDSGVQIEFKGAWYYLIYGSLRLRWDTENSWLLTIAESSKEAGSHEYRGLCGNMDDDPTNDMTTPAYEIVDQPHMFGNSWRKLSAMDNCPDIPDVSFNFRDLTSETAAKIACSPLHREPFSKCHEKVSVSHYYLRCVNDYCGVINYYTALLGKDSVSAEKERELQSVLCSAFGAYCVECAARKVVVEFRTAELCPKECPAGLSYSEAVPKCPRTCKNINSVLPFDCLNEFYPGCQCPEGTVMHDDKCIPGDLCPCYYQREPYAPNSVIRALCNTCTCKSGRWECTKMPCSKTCSVIGNQHFSTYDKQNFIYQGGDGCQYTLSKVRDEEVGKKGSIHVFYQIYDCTGIDVMCTQTVHVIHKIDEIETRVTLHDDFTAKINDHDYTDLSTSPYSNGYIYVKAVTSLFIIAQGFGFKVLYAPLGRIYMVFDPFYMNKLEGLCGNNDGDRSNDYETSDGMETTDVDAFAVSWVYGECLSKPSGNSYANPCAIKNIANMDAATKFCENVGRPEIFGRCRDMVGYEYYRDGCVYDMCARQNMKDNAPACNWMAAMARACKEYGVIVNWRDDSGLSKACPAYQCSGDLVYHECLSVCGNCRDRQLDAIYCEAECEAGCACPDGKLLDDYGNCVTPDKCTCYDHDNTTQSIKKAGELSVRGCLNCVCENGVWICEHEDANCSMSVQCPQHQIYMEEYMKCNDTCHNYGKPCTDDTVYKGCACEAGYVIGYNGTCIKPKRCPCIYNGEFYDRGKEVKIGCKTFICKNQHWKKISEEGCFDYCWAAGEAQYKTFDQFFYTFPGKCEYYLIKHPDLIVRARNVQCGIMGITCMKALVIGVYGMTFKYNTENELIFEGQSYRLDADGTVDITHGIYFRKSGMFRTIYFELAGLLIQHDSGTRVYIQLDRRWRTKIDGLCGNFNGIAEDDVGIVGTSVLDFGNSWKTESEASCSEVKEEAHKCEEHPEKVEWAQTFCGLIKSGSIFADCRKHVGDYETTYYKACLYDACSCAKGGDCECLCTALSNFVEACHRAGVIVNWRSQKLCPVMCPPGLEFRACGPGCHQSCTNMGDEPEVYCNKVACVEGCFCPQGQYLHGGKCVSVESCPCEVDGIQYSPGTIISKDCQTCTCLNSTWICVGARCIPSVCSAEQFACEGEQRLRCLHKDFLCDGVVDCPNGSDEYNCSFECATGEFKCYSSRTCIPDGYVCDGHPDCLDGSDEQLCPAPDCSDERFFLCENGRCIPKGFTCDGKFDCGLLDNSDEVNCPNITDCPSAPRFQCVLSGLCMPLSVVCDGHDDCGDGSDEKGCEPTSTHVDMTTTASVTPEPTSTHVDMTTTASVTPEPTTTLGYISTTDFVTTTYQDTTTTAFVPTECPPNEPEIITDFNNDGLLVVPRDVVTSSGANIPTGTSVSIHSPEAGDEFRLMELLLNVTGSSTVILTITLKEEPDKLVLMKTTLTSTSTVTSTSMEFRTTGKAANLPPEGIPGVTLVEITFEPDINILVSDLVVIACDKIEITVATPTSGYICPEGESEQIFDDPEDYFLDVVIRPTESDEAENVMNSYKQKATLYWNEYGTRESLTIKSPEGSDFTVISIGFNVTNAKSVKVQFWGAGVIKLFDNSPTYIHFMPDTILPDVSMIEISFKIDDSYTEEIGVFLLSVHVCMESLITEHPSPTPYPVPAPTPTPTPAPTSTTWATPTPTPSPYTEPTPTPYTKPTPTPYTEPTPTPYTEPSPTPYTEPTPAPYTEPTPTPYTEPTPTPYTEPTPTPYAEPTPTPYKEPTPIPYTQPTPMPYTQPTPTPHVEPTTTPYTESTKRPTPATLGPTTTFGYITTTGFDTTTIQDTATTTFVVTECPPNEPEIITDFNNDGLLVVPRDVVTSSGANIPTGTSVSIHSPEAGDEFRLMELLLNATGSSKVILTITLKEEPDKLVLTRTTLTSTSTEFRTTGKADNLPLEGIPGVTLVEITFEPDVNILVSDLVVIACDEIEITIATPTSGYICPEGELEQIFDDPEDYFLDVEIRPTESDEAENVMNSYKEKATLYWNEYGTRESLAVKSPEGSDFTVISIGFNVTNAKSVKIQFWGAGVTKLLKLQKGQFYPLEEQQSQERPSSRLQAKVLEVVQDYGVPNSICAGCQTVQPTPEPRVPSPPVSEISHHSESTIVTVPETIQYGAESTPYSKKGKHISAGQRKGRKRKAKSQDTVGEAVVELVKQRKLEMAHAVKPPVQTQNKDQDELFFEACLSQLREFPKNVRAEIKMEIMSLINKKQYGLDYRVNKPVQGNVYHPQQSQPDTVYGQEQTLVKSRIAAVQGCTNPSNVAPTYPLQTDKRQETETFMH